MDAPDTSTPVSAANLNLLAQYAKAGTFTADQRFSGKVGINMDPATLGTKKLGVVGASTDWAASISGGGTGAGALVVTHGADVSAQNSNAVDAINLFHKSTGDAIFAAHTGGVAPTLTFTANTAIGSNVLSAVSSFIGLMPTMQLTGTGIPAGAQIATTNTGAGTLTLFDANGNAVNATANGTGVTITFTQPAGGAGGNAIFNGLIPYYLDDVGTGLGGSIVNNRTGMQGLFIQNQAATNNGNAVQLKSWAASAALYINNQPASGAPASTGNGGAIVIDDNSTARTISINKTNTPAGGLATVVLGTSVASAIDVLRINDSGGAGRIIMRADGTIGLGVNYPTQSLQANRLQVEFAGTGIQRTLALTNNTSADGNGNQIELNTAGVQFALIQGVADSIASTHGSLRFQAKNAGTMREYLRLDGVNDRINLLRGSLTFTDAVNIAAGTTTGTKIGTTTTQKLGFYNAAPVVQPATTGTTTGFTAATGTTVVSGSTFTGNTGSTAYTIGDVVNAMKLLGLLAA